LPEKWQKKLAAARQAREKRTGLKAINCSDGRKIFYREDYTVLPPPVQVPSAPPPGRPLEDVLKRFYSLNRFSEPIAERMERCAFAGYRVYVYAGSYHITITRGGADNHVAVLYYRGNFNIAHAIAGHNFKGNYFSLKEVQTFLTQTVNLKRFKTYTPYAHVPY